MIAAEIFIILPTAAITAECIAAYNADTFRRNCLVIDTRNVFDKQSAAEGTKITLLIDAVIAAITNYICHNFSLSSGEKYGNFYSDYILR